jgi:hypothetical protein
LQGMWSDDIFEVRPLRGLVLCVFDNLRMEPRGQQATQGTLTGLCGDDAACPMLTVSQE